MIDLANEVRASDGLVPTYVTRVGVSLNLKRGTDSYGIGEESFAKMTRYHRVSVYGLTFRTAAIGSRYLAWCIANELCEKRNAPYSSDLVFRGKVRSLQIFYMEYL